ncbi:MAG TPA: RsmE family RNA methyltransferase [Nannocystaceae bacterium]|nr:RsmE family RNA methyltransferase [Nannocystaceae bacterium]
MTLRVFHRAPLTRGAAIEIDGEELHYLARVRRAKVGATLEVLDGEGVAMRAELARIDDRSATLVLGDAIVHAAIDPLELWLALGDTDACTTAIASACELGVTRIELVKVAHGNHAEPAPARIDRVVRAAMRQCGLPSPPIVVAARPLATCIDTSDPGGVIAWERLRGTQAPLPADVRPRLVVGPPGGLRDDEAEACMRHGMTPLSLGPWTLRTETATVAGLARLRARVPV